MDSIQQIVIKCIKYIGVLSSANMIKKKNAKKALRYFSSLRSKIAGIQYSVGEKDVEIEL